MNKINDKDAAMVLRQGSDEIEGLRRRIDVLQAKADVVDVFSMALSGKRPASQGFGEDVAWKMRKAADAMDGREKDEK